MGIRSESNDEMARRKTLEKAEKDRGLSILFSKLLKLLDDKKDSQQTNDKDVEPVKTLSKTSTPESTFEAAKDVNPKELSGFDKKEQKVTHSDSSDDTDLDEEDDDIKSLKHSSTKEHSSRSRSGKLPQAGERTNGILSLMGVFILLAGILRIKRKFSK